MPSRAVRRALLLTGPGLLFAAVVITRSLTGPDSRPPREEFEARCQQAAMQSPDVMGSRNARAVTFNYNVKGGIPPQKADFGSFIVSFNGSSTLVSGDCRLVDSGGAFAVSLSNIKTTQ
jgi:hypothetical protein